jgi:hypothetical protein
MKSFLTALRKTFSSSSAWFIGAGAFGGFLVLYLLTLPATFTGGAIGFAALAFLTPGLIVWSLLLAGLLAVLVPMTAYLLRRGYHAHAASGTAVGGLIISLVTPLLCCSPILPIIFSFLAGLLPAVAGGTGGRVQGFLATHEWLFFAVSAVLLIAALFWNSREVVKGACCDI